MPTRILVVDDEEDMELLFRQRYRRRIAAGDIRLTFSRNGREALDSLHADPDLHIVLTDINMPEMDGLTLLSRARALDRPPEVVIVSAYGDMKNIRTAMNRGAFDFLTKPLDFEDLNATIEKTARQVQKIQEGEAAQDRAAEFEERSHFIRDTFGRYVAEGVVDHLLDSPEGLSLGGEKRRVAMLSAELKGFIALAERLQAEEVVKVLNRYFEAMFGVATAHGGTISDIGSADFLVLFGAPIAQEQAARHAFECAVAMRATLDRVNHKSEPEALPPVEMGIGLHAGDVVIGNVGSSRRAKYGAVGSEVNLAERVASYATGGQILASEEILREAGPGIGVDAIMEIRPKGVQKSLTVHDIAVVEELGQ